MPSKNSYPVLITDIEELLEAVSREPELQPAIETERQFLAQALAEIHSLRGRQAELKSQRQVATQQLKAVLKKAKDAVFQIRSVLKGKVGPRDERLSHFKIVPFGRPRKKKAEETNGETPGTNPGAAGSPSVKAAA